MEFSIRMCYGKAYQKVHIPILLDMSMDYVISFLYFGFLVLV